MVSHLAFEKPKKQSLSKAKKKAWAVFSKYIRFNAADADGFVRCYTCGKRAHWKEMQAGHGIQGRNNAVLFMEAIVRPQCVGCNIFGGGKYGVFTRKLIDELGLKQYDDIVTQSNRTVKRTIVDYEAIYEAYRDLLKEIQEM